MTHDITLEAEAAELLPVREELSLFNINLMVPINLGAALNVLSSDADATALVNQFIPVTQQ